jgi:hypothetical protein
MPRLRLESATDAFDLDDITDTGWGIEALKGATGFGLPPVAVQWIEGAGDGSTFRGQRVMPRDIDIPLYFRAPTRAQLQELLGRFARLMSGAMTLRFVEDIGTDWSLVVHRVGGGTYVYGQDTVGLMELRTVVTLRAGDPYWVSSVEIRRTVGTAGAGRGLIKAASFTKLRLSDSSASGAVALENPGDVDAYPVWQITGPGNNFHAVGPNGDEFTWTGTLVGGETLTIDTRKASVVDGTGASRYSQLATAPRFWRVPPGFSSASVSMAGTTSSSLITLTWRPRKWAIV